MLKKSAVFFDIDGTLWDYRFAIPRSTIEGIHRLQANGHYAFICTGRSRSTVWDERLLGIGFDGIVAGCGTHIEMKDEILYEKLLSKEELQKVVRSLREVGAGIFLEGPKELYIDWDYFAGQAYAESFRVLGDRCVPLCAMREDTAVNKLSIDFRNQTVDEILAVIDPSRYHVIIHDSKEGVLDFRHIAEIVPQGHTKATGIAWVCKYLGIDREDTYAFGDGSNDVEMLTFAGCGIAMGNANDEAKKAADWVTTPLHEDGIFNGLTHAGLI